MMMPAAVIAPPIEDTRRGIIDSISKAMGNQGEFIVEKIELIHTPQGSSFRRDPLRIFRRANETDRQLFLAGRGGIDRMTSEILALAERQVDVVGRADRFKVMFHLANGDRTFYPFAIAPMAPEYGEEIAQEEAAKDVNEGTLVKAVMQQNRELHGAMQSMIGGFMHGMNQAMDQLRKQNDQLSAALTKRDEEHGKLLTEIEAARGKQHEREIESALVESEIQRKEFGTKKVMALLPVLASRLLSPGGDDDDDDDDDEDTKGKSKKTKRAPSEIARAMLTFGISITDEQKIRLGSFLSVEQQIALAEAVRVAKKGGSPMLATIVHDFVSTLAKAQIERLIEMLDKSQATALVALMDIAKREATANTEDEDGKKSTPVTGEAQAEKANAAS